MARDDSGGTATVEHESLEEIGLTPQQALDMYESMMLGRQVDERMWLLNRAGKAPFAVSVQGHEAAQAGMAMALDVSKDWLVPYYRDLILTMHFGLTPTDIMLAFLAKQGDPSSGGKQMPGHYGSRKYRILSSGSVVGTQMVHAPGIALAARMRGEDTVVVTSIGEGGTAQGDFHEGLNWASIYKLGVIFFIQNNHYAISVPMDKEMAIANVSERAQAYGMVGVTVDGADAFDVYVQAKKAVARARAGEGPTLFEAKVNRLTPHTSDDDDRFYRSREEVASYRETDPLLITGNRLRSMGLLTDDVEAEMQARVKVLVNEATEAAEAAPLPDPAEAFTDVYAADEASS